MSESCGRWNWFKISLWRNSNVCGILYLVMLKCCVIVNFPKVLELISTSKIILSLTSGRIFKVVNVENKNLGLYEIETFWLGQAWTESWLSELFWKLQAIFFGEKRIAVENQEVRQVWWEEVIILLEPKPKQGVSLYRFSADVLKLGFWCPGVLGWVLQGTTSRRLAKLLSSHAWQIMLCKGLFLSV